MKATNNREEDGDKRQNDADAKETKNTSSTHAKTFLETPPQSSPCQAVVSLSVPARETSSRTSRQPHEAIFPMKLMSNKHRRRHSYKNTGQYSYQHPKTTAMLTVPEILSYPRRLQERRRLQILCITPLVQSESLLEKQTVTTRCLILAADVNTAWATTEPGILVVRVIRGAEKP